MNHTKCLFAGSPLKVACIMNSFKESLTSEQANQAVYHGLEASGIPFLFRSSVFADGGQGTLEALLSCVDCQEQKIQVKDALLQKKTARYYIDDSGTAYMEMAEAAPLTMETRNHALEASTRGVGEMICHALDLGCRHFIIGLGGSATSDGGKDMLEALGFVFLDQNGHPAAPGNAGLGDICSIQADSLHPGLRESIFEIACDVENPLLGEQGAVAVFGPQKGAGTDLQKTAEKNMQNWAEQVRHFLHCTGQQHPENRPGAGAAGGLGFAFNTLLHAELKSGADLIIEKNKIEQLLDWADLIITGEGAFDSQSLQGKGPGRIIQLAVQKGKRVLIFAGKIDLDPQTALSSGADGFFSIMQGPCSLQQALDPENAAQNLKQAVFQQCLLIRSFLQQS